MAFDYDLSFVGTFARGWNYLLYQIIHEWSSILATYFLYKKGKCRILYIEYVLTVYATYKAIVRYYESFQNHKSLKRFFSLI